MKDKILLAVIRCTNESPDITFTPELIAAYAGTDVTEVEKYLDELAKDRLIIRSVLPNAYRLTEASKISDT